MNTESSINASDVDSHALFSPEELMHLDHAMYYHYLKRLDFFHWICRNDAKTRSGKTPTKGDIDLALKDSQYCEKLLMKIRELRKDNPHNPNPDKQ